MTFRFLASFHYHGDTDLAQVAAGYPGRCEVFADSGGYSAMTSGAVIRLPDYAAWLTAWAPLITIAATLDVIGDPAATRANTRWLEDRGYAVLPVFHVGSPWAALRDLCRDYTYVALGGMVPFMAHGRKPEVMRWLIRCFQIARDYGTVFHGFGQTGTPLAALPFYSADSSTWAAAQRYGKMHVFDPRTGTIPEVAVGYPDLARRYARLLRDHGADPVAVGRPGFALASRRTPAEFAAEDHMCRGSSAVAFDRFGRWLAGRHQVRPPPGHASPGTLLYLADVTAANLAHAASAISADHARTPGGTR